MWGGDLCDPLSIVLGRKGRLMQVSTSELGMRLDRLGDWEERERQVLPLESLPKLKIPFFFVNHGVF